MKKLLGILALGFLLAGCAYDLVETQTAEEFDQIARARGYAYTARAQPVSWITANGLVEHGDKQPAQGAHATQQQANDIAMDICKNRGGFTGCIIIRESGTITPEAKSIIARLKKEQKKKKVEKPKKKKQQQSPDDDKVVAAASGTGFLVSRNGHIITNHHVIDECKAVKVNFKGSEIDAKILAIDKTNDLAIIQAKINPSKVFAVSNKDVSLLQDIIVAGFPLGKNVSSAIKIHKGSVTALAGFGDNYSNFQTDATINQGNSGGPVMDQKGNIVGVAVALMSVEAGQNIFFAVKSSTLKTFASSNDITFLPPNHRPMSNKDLGQLITEGTVFLECWMTVAKIKQIIAQEENRKAFYSEHK